MLNDIQALVNKRAAEKLASDLLALRNLLQNHPLIGHTNEGQDNFPEFKVIGLNVKGSLYRLMAWGGLSDKLREYWYPIYVAKESKEFLDRVNHLQSQIDDLINQSPD